MGLISFAELISYEFEEKMIEIDSPNNQLYENKAEELEEMVVSSILRKQRTYQDAARIIIF